MNSNDSTSMDVTAQIRHLLYCLGIPPVYKGFFQVSLAVSLAVDQQERLLLVTKLIYPQVAKCYGTTWSCVERNIRTISEIAWLRNRPMLEELSHQPLYKRPTASAFVAILAAQFWE